MGWSLSLVFCLLGVFLLNRCGPSRRTSLFNSSFSDSASSFRVYAGRGASVDGLSQGPASAAYTRSSLVTPASTVTPGTSVAAGLSTTDAYPAPCNNQPRSRLGTRVHGPASWMGCRTLVPALCLMSNPSSAQQSNTNPAQQFSITLSNPQ
ncbi:hypothetical protein C8R44DRAFT_382761 [Mycena epipterygia]|nr:hypothetical protein C8R44DRAFT_382761 [Mycena epipterygia]